MSVTLAESGEEPLDRLLALPPAEEACRLFCRLCDDFTEKAASNRLTAGQQIIQAAQTYINGHYADPELTAEKLCRHLHVSSSYFSALFKRETGRNFPNYLTETRMRQAMTLLAGTDMKTASIAEAVGVPDPSYFSLCVQAGLRAFSLSGSQAKGGRCLKRNSGNGRSFSLQLTASFMACMGALLAFISISLMTPLSSLLEKNAFERTKETVLQSVSTANVFIDRLLSTLYFATTVLPDSMDSGAAGWVEQMQMIKKSDSDIISIALFHRDGTLLGAVGAGDVSLDTDEVASSEWFQKALAWGGTSTYFSSPFVQHIFSGQRTFVIRLARSAFYQKEDRLEQGVVLMDVSYASFSRLIEGVALGKSGYVYLLDRGGEIIAHPKLQLIYNGLHEENLDEINRLLIGQGRDKVDGRERVLIAATLNQTRWRLVGVAYLDELLVLQTAFVHILTVVLICALLLSLAVATMMSYRLMRPIRHVADAIGRVESGNLSEGIPETGISGSTRHFRVL